LYYKNLNPEECVVHKIIVTEINEGTANDIVIKDTGTDFYYINRGLEKGLSIKELNDKLINKKVTLHLPEFWLGTSEHIAQLELNDTVIYTEFSPQLNKN
jgi:hypothetical protein